MKKIARRNFLAGSGIGIGLLAAGHRANALTPEPKLPAPAAPGPENGELGPVSGPLASEVVVKRAYTECRFGQLHYIHGRPASGKSDFPALVLLHQNPSSSEEYELLIREMARDREVYAFDTPGDGMSDWPPDVPDMTGYAFAFGDGIDNLGLGRDRKLDVYGYHTGTLLGSELAIGRPDVIGRLVVSGIPYHTVAEREKHMQEIIDGPKLTESGDQILAMDAKLWDFVVTKRTPGIPLRRAAQIYMVKAKPMDRYWWPYIGVWNYEVPERYPLIRQPVLVLQPHSYLLENARSAAKFIRDVRFVELPDLNRDIFDVGVPQLAREMRKFLV